MHNDHKKKSGRSGENFIATPKASTVQSTNRDGQIGNRDDTIIATAGGLTLRLPDCELRNGQEHRVVAAAGDVVVQARDLIAGERILDPFDDPENLGFVVADGTSVLFVFAKDKGCGCCDGCCGKGCGHCKSKPSSCGTWIPEAGAMQDGQLIVCGRLLAADGVLIANSGHGIESLAIGDAGGGVRTWVITTTPMRTTLLRQQIVTFGATLFGPYSNGFFAPRLHDAPVLTDVPGMPGFSRATFEVYLVDATGAPIDPGSILEPDGPAVSIPFEMQHCGDQFRFAAP